MVVAFYNQKSLNNTLIIVINDRKIIDVKINDNFSVGYSENKEVSFINIFNFNKHMKVNEGYLKFDKQICQKVKEITSIDLSNFVDTNDFVVGQIKQCEEIKGTHLHKCVVNVGDNEFQIVCGAKNARNEIKVVVALNGAILPNGEIIKNGQLLGIKSFGMLCSKKELNLHSDKFNDVGIIELSPQYKVGDKFNEIFN